MKYIYHYTIFMIYYYIYIYMTLMKKKENTGSNTGKIHIYNTSANKIKYWIEYRKTTKL